MADIQKTISEIGARIYSHAKNNYNELGFLQNEKDWFLGMLYFLGEQEAENRFLYEQSEAFLEAEKVRIFLEQKKLGSSDALCNMQSKGLTAHIKVESLNNQKSYLKVKHTKESVSKMVDSISQKISILRREEEFNQHIK